MTTSRLSPNAWGYGAAQLIAPSTKRSTEVVVFLSDLHVPFHDVGLVRSALKLVKELQPDRLVLNGDVADFFQLSRFNSGQERLDLLQAEIDQANAIRRSLRTAAPDAHFIETEGNHDSRIKTYVAKNARALTSLRALEPEQLFGYSDLEIDHFPGAGFLQRPDFLVKHGTIVRGEGGASAKAELQQAGISGISGHTHRLAKYVKAGYSRREWTEGGCLCRLDPDYVVGSPNWNQGLAVGHFSTKTPSFAIELVQVLDGRLFYGGRTF